MSFLFRVTLFAVSVSLLTSCGRDGVSGDGLNNRAPIASAGDDQQLILSFGDVILDGSASSDPDSDVLAYAWQIIQSPPGSNATLLSFDSINTGFTPDVVGTYRVELTVSDPSNLTHNDMLDIDVAANQVPTANAGADRTVNRAEDVILEGSGSIDPDGHSLTYTWTQLNNACPDVTGGTGALSGAQPTIKAPDVVCTLAFDLRVDDGGGASFADRVYVFVLEDKANAFLSTVAAVSIPTQVPVAHL